MSPSNYKTIVVGHVMSKIYASVCDGHANGFAEVVMALYEKVDKQDHKYY